MGILNKDHKKLLMTLPEPGKGGGTALKMDKVIKGHPCSPERAERQPKNACWKA